MLKSTIGRDSFLQSRCPRATPAAAIIVYPVLRAPQHLRERQYTSCNSERIRMHRARPITVQLRAAAARFSGRYFVFCILYRSSSSLLVSVSLGRRAFTFPFVRRASCLDTLRYTYESREPSPILPTRQLFRNLHLPHLTFMGYFLVALMVQSALFHDETKAGCVALIYIGKTYSVINCYEHKSGYPAFAPN